MSIAEFIVSPWGIVCVGILSSIAATFLYKTGEKLYAKASENVKRKRFARRLARLGEIYCSGYTAAYAKHKSSFLQILHINDFVMKLLKVVLVIMLVSFSSIGLLMLFHEIVFARPLIIAIACVIIAIKYQSVKTLCETYQIMVDNEFGEEYEKRMMDGMEHYWDEVIEKNKKKAEDS